MSVHAAALPSLGRSDKITRDYLAASLFNVDGEGFKAPAVGTVISVRAGREVYGEGSQTDAWYQVVSGVVRTSKLMQDGRRQIGQFLLPGDVFGMEPNSSHQFAAEAVTSATVIRHSRTQVQALADENPKIARRLLDALLKDLGQTQERILRLGRKTAEEKMASFILEMLDRLSVDDTLDLPMSRTDIADYLGLTIETVSRTLSLFKRERIIALPTTHRLVVVDRESLEELAGA